LRRQSGASLQVNFGGSATIQYVGRAETLWIKIIGVLLILVGLVLLASPHISYTTREKVISSGSVEITAKRHKTVNIPRVVGLLPIGGGVILLMLAGRKP